MSYPYFNDYASIHPTSSTREEFDGYQPLDQTPAAQEVNYQGPRNTFTDFWGTFEQSGLTDGSTTTLPSTAGHGKHCCNLFIDWCLTLGLQSHWLWPPRI